MNAVTVQTVGPDETNRWMGFRKSYHFHQSTRETASRRPRTTLQYLLSGEIWRMAWLWFRMIAGKSRLSVDSYPRILAA